MMATSPLHFILLFVLASGVVPASLILKRTGHSPWWSVLYFIPLVGLIGMWFLAFARWPAMKTEEQASTVL